MRSTRINSHTACSLEVQFNLIFAPLSSKFHCAPRQTLALLPVPRHVTQCSESSGAEKLKRGAPPPQVFDPVAVFSTIDSELHQTSPDNSKFVPVHVPRPRQEILPIPKNPVELEQEAVPSQQRSLLHVPLGFSGSLPLFKKIQLFWQVAKPLQHIAPTFFTLHSLHVVYPSQTR